MAQTIRIDPTNPGQYFAALGLAEWAHRLWPGDRTTGHFSPDGREFILTTPGTLAEIIASLTGLTGKEVEVAGGDAGDDESAGTAYAIEAPVRIYLDWWTADPAWKTWSGSMTVDPIVRALVAAIAADPDGAAAVAADPMNFAAVPRDVVVGKRSGPRFGDKRESFGLDSRRGTSARGLDVGFVPDKLNKSGKGGGEFTTAAWPVVELGALVGLQRCRPVPVPRAPGDDLPRDVVRGSYATWTVPADVRTFPAAVAGLLDDRGRRYVMTTDRREPSSTASYHRIWLPG